MRRLTVFGLEALIRIIPTNQTYVHFRDSHPHRITHIKVYFKVDTSWIPTTAIPANGGGMGRCPAGVPYVRVGARFFHVCWCWWIGCIGHPKGGKEFYFWFRSQGIARTQFPTNINCTPESSTFGKIARSQGSSQPQCNGGASPWGNRRHDHGFPCVR